MSTFRTLHLRRFSEHKARTALSLAGLAVGAGLVVAVLGFIGTLDGSVTDLVEGLSAGADLEINAVSDEGFDEELYFDVEDAPGVQAAAPILRTPGLIEDRRVLLIGLDRRAESFGLQASVDEEELAERFEGRFGIVLSAKLAHALGIASGDEVSVVVGGDARQVLVLGALEQLDDLNQGLLAVGALPVMQQVTGKQGRLDSVLVKVGEGAEPGQVAAVLRSGLGPQVEVAAPEQRIRQARAATNDLRSGLVMGAAIAVSVGAFLIYNTMSFVATERRRELATLRALGGNRLRLFGAFLLEAALLGVIGGALGSVLGYFVARESIATIPGFVSVAIGAELAFSLPAYAIPAAIGLGATASVLAAAMPGWRAVSADPAEAMRPEGVIETIDPVPGIIWGPGVLGALAMAGAVWVASEGPGQYGFLAIGALQVGVIVLTYGLMMPFVTATAGLSERFGTTGRLAGAAILRAPRRGWATGVAVIIATGMIVAQVGIFHNVSDTLRGVVTSLAEVDLYVSATGQDEINDDVLLPPGYEDDLLAIDGVEHVGLNVFSFVRYRDQRILLQGVEGSVGEAPAMAPLDPRDRLLVESGEGAVVSDRFAELYGVGVGDTLEMPSPNGTWSIPVIASVPAFSWERGQVTVGRKVLVAEYGREGLSDYMLVLDEGVSAADVEPQIAAVFEGIGIPVIVTTSSETVAIIFETVDTVTALFGAMAWVVVGAATLAILNALLMSVVERRRELGIMRALGTSRRQMRFMVALEALALGVVGSVVGMASGILVHRAALQPISDQSGFSISYSFLAEPLLLAGVIGITIAVVGSFIPAIRAGKVNIVEAIGYE